MEEKTEKNLKKDGQEKNRINNKETHKVINKEEILICPLLKLDFFRYHPTLRICNRKLSFWTSVPKPPNSLGEE